MFLVDMCLPDFKSRGSGPDFEGENGVSGTKISEKLSFGSDFAATPELKFPKNRALEPILRPI
jgi:hypothetical protein